MLLHLAVPVIVSAAVIAIGSCWCGVCLSSLQAQLCTSALEHKVLILCMSNLCGCWLVFGNAIMAKAP